MRTIPGRPEVFRVSDKYLILVGLRGKPRSRPENIALIPAHLIASKRHLLMAVIRAIRSFHYGVNISDKFAYEVCVCLLGIREVSKVIKLLSVDQDEYALIIQCERIEDCLRSLIRITMEDVTLSDIKVTYEPQKLTSCTGNIECIAMEQGIPIELER
jgi:tRNA threonylcarbamoyladenosine modification (KEOPS) complex Cgi121 subunit